MLPLADQPDVVIEHVPVPMIGKLVPHVSRFIDEGVVAANIDLNELSLDLSCGKTQMWIVFFEHHPVAVVFTSIILRDDGSKYLDVFGMAGERAIRWGLTVSDHMARFAKAEGCSSVICMGRMANKRLYGPDVQVIGQRDGAYIFERSV